MKIFLRSFQGASARHRLLEGTAMFALCVGGDALCAPNIDTARSNPRRVLNEVLFEFNASQFLNVPSVSPTPVGLWIHGINIYRGNTLHETVSMGDNFNGRSLAGSWTASFGNFRFTRPPGDSPAPNNRAAAIYARVPADATRIEVLARRTGDLQAGLPSQTMSVFANGQGIGTAVPASGNSPVAYQFPFTLQDRYQLFISGPGTATLREFAVYNSAAGAAPIRTDGGLSLAIPSGGAAATHVAAYSGPVTDVYVRVDASGANSASRLIVRTVGGQIIINAPLGNGSREFLTTDTDDVRRNADARFATATNPDRAVERIAFSESFATPYIGWTANSGSAISLDGESLNLSGPGTGAAMILRLPRTFNFDTHPYLTMRMRASRNFVYFIRPVLSTSGSTTPGYGTKFKSAMEQRKGTGADETVTFNLKSMQERTQAPATGMNQIWVEMIPDNQFPPAPGTTPQFNLSFLAINAGMRPAAATATETAFDNSLDDDGDFLVDRDDPDFRAAHPRQVLVNYQTIFQEDGIGFSGIKAPWAGNAGGNVTVDYNVTNPANNKRHIRSIFYPLDYVKHPNYTPPAYNPLADQNAQGRWSPCAAPNAPPTNQFPSLNYSDLGAIEEYNPRGAAWIQAQLDLTRRHAIDGWIYNDNGNDREINADRTLPAVAERLAANRNPNSFPPFKIASFFVNLPSLEAGLGEVVAQLSYIAIKRQRELTGYMTFRGRPLLFVYPSRLGPTGPLRFSLDQWNSTLFPALRNPFAANFDGPMSAPLATANTLNTLVLNFDRTRNDLPGGPFAGAIASIQFFDRNLQPVGPPLQFGNPTTRANNIIDGFGDDVPAGVGTDFPYTTIQRTDGGTPGMARVRVNIPSSAAVMTMHLLGFSGTPELGGQPQNCSLRVNTTGGSPAITFNAIRGWNTYTFRLRNLPAGFSEASTSTAPAAEMAMSIFGDIQELVRPGRETTNASGFAGYASYVNSFFDGRTEVSYPYIQAATLWPGFDQSGFFYACETPDPFFEPRENGARYRRRWETILDTDPDMAIITSFNEWGEGTNIEPDIEHGFQYMRLTLTYSLLYKGIMETGRAPSATGLLTTRFDPNGRNRTISFSLNGPDTVKLSRIPWGPNGAGVSITRNGSPVTIGGSAASFSGTGARPVLTLNAPAGASNYTITYNSGDGLYGCFVDRLYRDILKRDPDQGGYDFYVNSLTANTISMPQTAANFLFSPEFTNSIGFIARCYFAIFNNNSAISFTNPAYRIPDRPGLLFWADVLASRPTLAAGQEAVVVGFTSSPEWIERVGDRDNPGFVDFLYENILGRAPDPAGKAFHVANLNNGTSTRPGLILQFLNSPEAVAKYRNMGFSVMAYLGLLDRAAEQAGFVFHTNRLNSGLPTTAFLNGFLMAAEYVNRLAGLSCQHPLF